MSLTLGPSHGVTQVILDGSSERGGCVLPADAGATDTGQLRINGSWLIHRPMISPMDHHPTGGAAPSFESAGGAASAADPGSGVAYARR